MLYGKFYLFIYFKKLQCLNPYFFGKCSTAFCENNGVRVHTAGVLILIFLENALRRVRK